MSLEHEETQVCTKLSVEQRPPSMVRYGKNCCRIYLESLLLRSSTQVESSMTGIVILQPEGEVYLQSVAFSHSRNRDSIF